MRMLVLIALGLAVACPVRAADSLVDGADRAAIHRVIQDQMEAFQRDDGAAAFAFAAPRIKSIFRDPDTFMNMVRDTYAPVYRPAHVSFRDLERIDGKLIQPVLVIGPSGVPVTALYIMERMDDGVWRIGGVVLVAEPDKGA